jgi:hypothetical protein
MPARPSRPTDRATTRAVVRRALPATVVVALALPLAACTGDDEPEPTPTPSDEGTPLVSLLSDYLEDWSGEDVARRLAEMEERIAACMAEEGFDYTPVDWSGLDVDLSAGLELAYGSLEFAEQFGYGITTDPFVTGANEVTDPNAEYVAAMSDAERDAYLTALHGEGWADPDPADETVEGYDWQTAGCSGRAQHEVVATGIEDEQFAALQEEMLRMAEEADGDPRLAQANTDWAACMLDAGYDGLAKVGDGEAAIAAEVEAARAEVYGTAGGSATLPTDPGAAAREALRRGLTEPSLEAAFDEAVAAITPREIEMAVADAGCRAETGYDDVRRSVDTQYQLAFLAEHADEIQSWMAALAADREADE